MPSVQRYWTKEVSSERQACSLLAQFGWYRVSVCFRPIVGGRHFLCPFELLAEGKPVKGGQ